VLYLRYSYDIAQAQDAVVRGFFLSRSNALAEGLTPACETLLPGVEGLVVADV
jgi:hypothetical protein